MKRFSCLTLILGLLVSGVAHADSTTPIGYHFPKNAAYRGTDGLFHTLTNTLRQDDIGTRVPGLDANGNISGTVVGNIANGVVSGTSTALDMWNKLQTISAASSDATTQVTAMQSQIKSVQTSLTYEVSRAQTAEQTLQQNITNEFTRANKAEQLLMPILGGTFTGQVSGTSFTASSGLTSTGGSILASSGAAFDLSGNAGTLRNFYLSSGSSHRFTYGLNSGVEDGNNDGSNFFMNAYSDDGTTQSGVYTINRATRVMNFNVSPTAPTAAAADSSNQLATTQFVKQVAAGYVPMGGATGDVNFSGTLTSQNVVTAKGGVRGSGTGPLNDGKFSQGWSIGWNQETGSLGETDYVNMPGSYTGGFAWYNQTPDVWTNTTTHPNPLMFLSNTGTLTTTTDVASAYNFSQSSGGSVTSSSDGSVSVNSGTSALTVGTTVSTNVNASINGSNYPALSINNTAASTSAVGMGVQTLLSVQNVPMWAIGADGAHASATTNSGLDFFVTRMDDSGNTLDRPISVVRATGQVKLNTIQILGDTLSSADNGVTVSYGSDGKSSLAMAADGSLTVTSGSSPVLVANKTAVTVKTPLQTSEIDSSGPIVMGANAFISNSGAPKGGIKFEGNHISYWGSDGTLAGYWGFGDTTPTFQVKIPEVVSSDLTVSGVISGNQRNFVNGGGAAQIYTDAATSSNTANNLVFKVSPDNGTTSYEATLSGSGVFTAPSITAGASITAPQVIAAEGLPTSTAGTAGYSFSGDSTTGMFSDAVGKLHLYAGGAVVADLNGAASTIHSNTFSITGGSAYTDVAVDADTTDLSSLPTQSRLMLQKNHTIRWGVIADTTLETGHNNTGSNFTIASYSDTGTVLDYPIAINRSTSLITTSKDLKVSGGVTAAWGSGPDVGYGFYGDAGNSTGMFSTAVGQLTLRAGGVNVIDIEPGTTSPSVSVAYPLNTAKAVTFNGTVDRISDPATGDSSSAVPTTRWVNAEMRSLSTANTYGIADTCSTQGCLYVTTAFNVVTTASSDGSGALTLPTGSSAINGSNYVILNRSPYNICIYAPGTTEQMESLAAGACLTLAPMQTLHFISAGDGVHWSAY